MAIQVQPIVLLSSKDRDALRDFREQSEKLKEDWRHLDSCEDLGALPGVETTNGLVTALELDSKEIKGTLDLLQNLEHLVRLDLNLNALTGTLDPLRNLEHLVDVRLVGNALSGSLDALQNLKNLQTLHLSCNNLTGSLKPLFGLEKLASVALISNPFEITPGPYPNSFLSIVSINQDMWQFLSTPVAVPQHDVVTRMEIFLVIFAVVIGYADIISDLYATAIFFIDGNRWWFALSLGFVLLSGIVSALLSPRPLYVNGKLSWEELRIRILSIFQLRLLLELYLTLDGFVETQAFVTAKYTEAIFEAVPQLWLQMYVALRTHDEVTGVSHYLIFSIVSSALSLAWTVTCLLDKKIIATFDGNNAILGSWCDLCWYGSWIEEHLTNTLSLLVCWLYHAGEIAIQLCFLGLVSYYLRWVSFFTLLPYLIITRWGVYWIGQGLKFKCVHVTCSKIWEDFVPLSIKIIGGIFFETTWQNENSFIAGFLLSSAESIALITAVLSGALDPVSGQNIPASVILYGTYAGIIAKMICYIPLKRIHYNRQLTKVQPDTALSV